MDNKNERKDDYYVLFNGAKLTKNEANKIGIGILFGIVGIVVLQFLPFEKKSFISYLILAFFVLVGYFLVAPKIFRKNKKSKKEK